MLADLSVEELDDCITLIEEWFREDVEIEKERFSDPSYKSVDKFLDDLEEHKRQRAAMAKMLKLLEDERDRRKADAGIV